MEKLCHTTSCQLVVDRENKNKENSATKYKKTYISGKIYVPQLVLDLQLVEKGVQLDEFNKHKKKTVQQDTKTYKTQNQREKLCPTASCWLVVCRENKKKKKSATNKILKTYKTQNQMEK